MNDYMEVHWGYMIWEKVANNLIEEFGFEFIDYIDQRISSNGIRGLIVASCFSKNGDVLSQWRGYADDGKGYVIGFKATELLKLPIRALEVLYNEKKQVEEVQKVVRALYEAEKTVEKKFGPDFNTLVHLLGYDLAALKNPAFIEEKEIRLIHLLDFKKSGKFLKLNDHGGVYFGEQRLGEKIQFRIKQDIPTPFIELDFTNNNKINPIAEVIIGPKNPVKKTAISIFMETIGLSNVTISNSKASYQ
ncbi:DUF2971 domain-containing protein [Flavobacterium paronense]|uniref:DUF2971 domain-containing protein n=1 Tax=Flavobacterium paronense TaxID=1392775 RepID=A0ABV5GFZ6_9FLAO|nr:DUF2971 domain-containing protein [Flavobacterium paronense]MDN3676329.1 DUF2971 domain-containing protein [Flavobacterium paronense]